MQSSLMEWAPPSSTTITFTVNMSCFTILFCLLLPYMIQSVPFASRTVYDPPITSPNAQTVWMVGETTTVTWHVPSITFLQFDFWTVNRDVSSLPANLTNIGMLVLGYEANNSENLMLGEIEVFLHLASYSYLILKI